VFRSEMMKKSDGSTSGKSDMPRMKIPGASKPSQQLCDILRIFLYELRFLRNNGTIWPIITTGNRVTQYLARQISLLRSPSFGDNLHPKHSEL